VAEAVEHVRRAADLAPRSAAVRLLLADTLRRAGDMDGMAREYRITMHLARGGALATIAREQLKAARERAAP
jgi:Flp pilus assembly protein TadD